MRLWIPVVDERGMEAGLSPHFGSAPYFALVETDDGHATIVKNEHARRAPGQCNPARALEGRGVDAVICRGLGRGALERLMAQGLLVLVTSATTVADAVADYRNGRLRALTEEEACHGGGRGYGQRHALEHDPV